MKKGHHKTINIQMKYSTKNRLENIKLNKNESYDSVIQRLLYLEEKYNSADVDVTYEYEIFIDDMSKLFKIRWLNDSYIIYYYDYRNHDWSRSASAWGSSDDDTVSLFIDRLLFLLAKDDARALLMNMTTELVLEGYSIKKIQ